jgi:hypothetical protein
LVLEYELRFKASLSVARAVDIDLSIISDDGFTRVAIAGVGAGSGLVFLISKVLVEFSV